MIFQNFQDFYKLHFNDFFANLSRNPFSSITTVLDILIVFFIIYKAFKMLKDTRAWQLLKGIAILVIITLISGYLKLTILNYILTSVMSYGVIMLIIVFQPELRRALEQLGTTNRISRFLGIEQDINVKKKENIYKIVIAAVELSKKKVGALIVIERDIKLKDIVSSGIYMNSDISPQLLVNIFEPNTPLHDGAVIISENKIAAAACMLPLAGDKDIAKELGTRHRAAIGISKESDAIAIVVSEETGKVSIAKDGTLIADLKEDALKKILIKNVITKRFSEQAKPSKMSKFKNSLKTKFKKEK